MSTMTFTLSDVNRNRDVAIPANNFRHPVTDEQFLELAGLMQAATTFWSSNPPAWQEGHTAGLLMAITIVRRSSELHPAHDPSLDAI